MFAKPVLLPKGAVPCVHCTLHNSSSNPPNPGIDVKHGPQSSDEMQVSFMRFILALGADPAKLFPHHDKPAE